MRRNQWVCSPVNGLAPIESAHDADSLTRCVLTGQSWWCIQARPWKKQWQLSREWRFLAIVGNHPGYAYFGSDGPAAVVQEPDAHLRLLSVPSRRTSQLARHAPHRA